jgi:hypothetical protein
MLSLPIIRLDPDRARAWLTEPNPQDPVETNAERCGVYLDGDGASDFGYLSHDLHARIEDLLGEASEAGLFGDRIELQSYATADHDGTVDGAVLVVTVTRQDGGRPLRLASYHLTDSDLVWDRELTGLDAAVGVLRAAAANADEVLRVATAALGVLSDVECDECGAQLPAEPVSTHHLRSCSLHPDNIVDPHAAGDAAQQRPATTDVRHDQARTVGEEG